MIDVACVCVGEQYSPQVHVQQLYLAVKQHLHVPFRFNVITDQPDHPFYDTIECRTLRIPEVNLHGQKAWWYKPYLFSTQFKSRVLYFDLDVVIINDITKFTTYKDNFCICQDFNRRWIKDYSVSNSSVMCWHAPDYYDVWDRFASNSKDIIRKFRGDQDYITDYFKSRNDLTWWPHDWAMSFKWEIFRGGLIKAGTGLDNHGNWPADESAYAYPKQPWIVPNDCSVVVFHGKPDPWETDYGKQNLIPNVQ